MTVTHHPSDDALLDYALGRSGESWLLAVATHATFCARCRNRASALESVGGIALENVAPVAVAADARDRVAACLNDAEVDSDTSHDGDFRVRHKAAVAGLPVPLAPYVAIENGSLPWRALGRGAYHIALATGDSGGTARLLRIPAGKPVPEHGHKGLELTVVLSGAFSDGDLWFGPGDLQEADDDIVHRPLADPGDDCICLAVTAAPLRFKSLAARLVQPFIGI
jgi:putative transcriptional regulator